MIATIIPSRIQCSQSTVTHVITSANFATQVQGYTCVNGVPLGGLPSSGFWAQTKNISLTVFDIDNKGKNLSHLGLKNSKC